MRSQIYNADHENLEGSLKINRNFVDHKNNLKFIVTQSESRMKI